jgi:hypothetical protein
MKEVLLRNKSKKNQEKPKNAEFVLETNEKHSREKQ